MSHKLLTLLVINLSLAESMQVMGEVLPANSKTTLTFPEAKANKFVATASNHENLKVSVVPDAGDELAGQVADSAEAIALKNAAKELELKLAQSEESKGTAEAQVEELKAELANLQAKVEELQTETDASHGKLKVSEDNNAALSAEITSLKEALKEATAKKRTAKGTASKEGDK